MLKKNKTVQKLSREPLKIGKSLSKESILEFQDDFQKLASGRDEPTQAISIRIPENVLRSIKLIATLRNQRYQSLIVSVLRDFVMTP
ncbi:MAG: hypothetical protein JWQ35_1092 [Bacteriovoracaceae bacterium]|nr:hypothetical protein [Bacteriovoracaceae bacterium]